ncbi:hypothetical protein LguiB_027912 [Lonicera macranthoides]
MKTHHPKLKPPPRPLFSCAFFRHCSQTVLSPTTTTTPPPIPLTPPPPPPPRPPPPPPQPSDPPPSSSSSSSNTSQQSFTQWKFPLPNSPISPHLFPPARPDPPPRPSRRPDPVADADLPEIFHVAELQLGSGSGSDRVKALYMLERSLVPNTPEVDCPAAVMRGVVGYLKERVGAKPATKVLLALCLAEGNRHMAVEVGAVGQVVEALADLEGAAAERALAALELMCTVAEGAAELRSHALAVPMIVEVMGRMGGRGREYAISVMGVIFGGDAGDGPPAAVAAPPEEVARAVMLGLQGDCTARGRRKGAQLLKTLQENGRLDLSQEGGQCDC